MKKNKISKAGKVFKSYKKLNMRDQIIFQNILNRDNKIEKLRKFEERSLIASTIFQSLQDNEGKPYLNVDWVAKNIMGLTPQEIQENKALKNGTIDILNEKK